MDLHSPLFYSEGHRVPLPSTPKSASTPRRPMRQSTGGHLSARSGAPGSPKKGGASPQGKVESFELLPAPTGSFTSDIDATDLAALYSEREELEPRTSSGASASSPSPRSASKKTTKGAGQRFPQEESRPSSSMSMRGAVFHSEGDIPLPRSPKNGRGSRPALPLRAVTERQMPRPGTSGGTPQGTPKSARGTGRAETADFPPVSSCSFNSDVSDRELFSSLGEGMDSVKESPRSPSKKFSKGAPPRMFRPETEQEARPSSSMSMRSRSGVEPLPPRRLSFVGMSINDVWQAIQEEEPFLDWLPEFWDRVLTAPCPAACKTLALRSLANWVAIYNRWQAVGEWKPGQAPRFFNAFEAQQMLGIPLPRVMDFVKLFDPPGYARANQTKSPQDYVRIKLPVSPSITVCILMSTAICKKQKIRFLLGVFDENDNRTFEEEEFVEMLLALFRGMAAMFNLLNMKEVLPSVQRMEALAKHLFRRIIDFYQVKTGNGLVGDSVPFQVIQDWLLGDSSDALNAPFALFIHRYSTPGEEEDPEIFEDEDQKFRLSHTAPVDLPLETAASLDATFSNRHELVVAQKLFNYCLSTGGFGVSHSAAEAAVGPIDAELWIDKLHRALDATEDARGVGRTTFTSFLKRLCPKATARHLRMFHSWLKEYQHLEELQSEVGKTRLSLRRFQNFIALPKLPVKMRQEMSLDWQTRASESELEDYVENCCPPDFRPFPGDPVVDAVIEELLQLQLAQQELMVQRWMRLFAPRKSPEASLCSKPAFLKPKVPMEEWQKWNQVLDLFEVPAHGRADRDQLLRTRMLSKDIVAVLGTLLPKQSFSRDGFLHLMCQLKNYRPR